MTKSENKLHKYSYDVISVTSLLHRKKKRHQNNVTNFFSNLSPPIKILATSVAWRNSKETQQWGHASRSGTEFKNRRSSAKDGAPERHGFGAVKEEMNQILQRVSAGAA